MRTIYFGPWALACAAVFLLMAATTPLHRSRPGVLWAEGEEDHWTRRGRGIARPQEQTWEQYQARQTARA